MVTKVPRFAFEKFPEADSRLTTQMKSVGEVMAIGRTFQESLQKALRGLEIGVDGFDERTTDREEIEMALSEARPERLWYIADAFRIGMHLDEIQRIVGNAERVRWFGSDNLLWYGGGLLASLFALGGFGSASTIILGLAGLAGLVGIPFLFFKRHHVAGWVWDNKNAPAYAKKTGLQPTDVS